VAHRVGGKRATFGAEQSPLCSGLPAVRLTKGLRAAEAALRAVKGVPLGAPCSPCRAALGPACRPTQLAAVAAPPLATLPYALRAPAALRASGDPRSTSGQPP
jgi:hypothetical protein